MELAGYSDSELIRIISEFDEIQAMRTTADLKSAISCGASAGLGASIGGLSWGLIGVAIGAALGGIAAMPKNQCRSVSKILMNDLNGDQKKELADVIRDFLNTRRIWNAAALSDNLIYNNDFKEDLKSIVKTFLKEMLNYNIYIKKK